MERQVRIPAGFSTETVREAPVLSRHVGELAALVQCFGSSWGYTIWLKDRCLRGAKNWDWTLDDACAKADTDLSLGPLEW